MIPFIAENLAPIMFATLVLLLLLGYPVAFTLAGTGLFFFAIGVELAPYSGDQIHLFWPLLQALPNRFFGGVMANSTLLAVPFFTFMGLILERSGMAEDLLETIGQLFGPVRGGLAYAVIFVGALLAATTGVVAASVIAMGLISLPIMLRYGYDRKLAAGAIVASGTLAQIIPPSLVLIVLADQLGRSVGDMYSGALVPGLMLSSFYVLYVVAITFVRARSAPALPPEARTLGRGILSLLVALVAAVVIAYAATRYFDGRLARGAGVWGAVTGILAIYVAALVNKAMKRGFMSYLAQQVIIVMIPPLALIFLVLGTIFLGIATPTEGGAMGAVGALVLAFSKRRFSLDLLVQAMQSTTKLSAFVLFILIGSRVFSLTFYGVNGHLWVEHLLTSVPGGETGFLIAVNAIVFVLAFFLDFFELAFIIVPLLAPVADKLGIDLIWFGVLLAINMQTSFMHPPFGFALFYLRSVAPRTDYIDRVTGERTAGIRTSQIYLGAIPFVCIQIAMIAITLAFPGIVMRYKATPEPAPAASAPATPGKTSKPASGGSSGNGGNEFGLPPLGDDSGFGSGGGNGNGNDTDTGLPGLGPLEGNGSNDDSGLGAAPDFSAGKDRGQDGSGLDQPPSFGDGDTDSPSSGRKKNTPNGNADPGSDDLSAPPSFK
ncbi:TRAP transporter large permease [Pararhizobium mangrovi]|uniref:TRAP transporter large permease subunit n=1 Tax=Pararhizobium mangrovi TaxID=2590452 RepID=A0A506U8J5_9HYPH|nr:TRAP transporter large permease subunit [Pararhizobium mangrovi]TPW30673.1 TRAP transporter large permease subunit [Pararhizobium mangrovi]